MTKKHFIALADAIKQTDREKFGNEGAYQAMLDMLATFCMWQNPRFDRARWLAYIAGTCGPNGGKVKVSV